MCAALALTFSKQNMTSFMVMIYFKGDTVRLKSGMAAEVVDVGGKVREWYKLRTENGETVFLQSKDIELIRRYSTKRKGWGAR